MMITVIRSLNLFSVSVGVLLASMLFLKRLERRKYCPLRYIACFAAMFGFCLLLSVIKSALVGLMPPDDGGTAVFVSIYVLTMLTQCAVFGLGVACVFAIYKVDFSEALFIGSAAYALQSVAMCLFGIAMKLSGYNYQINIQDILGSPQSLAFLALMYAGVYAAAYFCCIRNYVGERDFIGKLRFFLVLIVFTNIFMSCASVPPEQESVAQRLYMVLLIGRMLLCGSGFIIQFILLNNYSMRIREVTMQRVMEEQKAQFEIAKENMDRVNINAHDLRKQISLILQSNGSLPEKQIGNIERELNIVDSAFRTGNKALDITLTEKARECLNKEIKLSAIADGECLSSMDDLDIYMLFGNLLDNAIEAAEKVADDEGRIISFTLNKSRGCIFVHVENTFSEQPRFVGGDPVTLKSDKRFHGFGVKSIKSIANKYGGRVGMKVSHGMFCVDILMTADRSAA